jgi:hypothetical protein
MVKIENTYTQLNVSLNMKKKKKKKEGNRVSTSEYSRIEMHKRNV